MAVYSGKTGLEIMQKAIAKAEENGWANSEGMVPIDVSGSIFLLKDYAPDYIFFDVLEFLLDPFAAQALWGSRPYYMMEVKHQHEFEPDGTNKAIEFRAGPGWELRMFQILFAKDRIKLVGELMEL